MKSTFLFLLRLRVLFLGMSLVLQGCCNTPSERGALHGSERSSRISHIGSIEALWPAVEGADKDTLFVFDVDYVLTASRDLCGRPKGLKLAKAFLESQKNGSSREVRERCGLLVLQKSPAHPPVEEAVLEILSRLEDRNIPAVALTALFSKSGYPSFVTIDPMNLRVQRLEAVGIRFPRYSQIPRVLWGADSGFDKGIIFSGKQPKGAALAYFLKNLAHFKPKKIIFVDDHLLNVQSVQAFCKQEKIPFEGFHYEADVFQKDPDPDPKMVELQMKTLMDKEVWLTDAEAKARLAATPSP